MKVMIKLALQSHNLNARAIDDFAQYCNCGQDALNEVRHLHETYGRVHTLVLTDISMPGMDGYQLTTAIRAFATEAGARQPHIIAVSGHQGQAYQDRAWNSQVDELVEKPATSAVIKDIVDQFFFAE